jgi:hypothetical protein
LAILGRRHDRQTDVNCAKDHVATSRAFQKRMQSLGGDVTVDVLPEAGIRGNGHILMLERNNKEIMDRLVSSGLILMAGREANVA